MSRLTFSRSNPLGRRYWVNLMVAFLCFLDGESSSDQRKWSRMSLWIRQLPFDSTG